MSINGSACKIGDSLTIVSTTPCNTTLLESFAPSVSVSAMGCSFQSLERRGWRKEKRAADGPAATLFSLLFTLFSFLQVFPAGGDEQRHMHVLHRVAAAGGRLVVEADELAGAELAVGLVLGDDRTRRGRRVGDLYG